MSDELAKYCGKYPITVSEIGAVPPEEIPWTAENWAVNSYREMYTDVLDAVMQSFGLPESMIAGQQTDFVEPLIVQSEEDKPC